MRVTDDWISAKPTQRVCAVLESAGFQALFVGGCVRNALLGVPVSDIDIATDAVPTTVMALAKDAGLHAIPTGIDHGTVTLVADGIAHEVTTFRADVETDGRHAKVAFSTDIETDAARRDFTMNALYADARGQVMDPLNGLVDLKARRVRFIGNAHDRITEDHLRSMRFFRFSAWYGDPDLGFDAEALAAIADHLDGLDALSIERVTSELIKTCGAANPALALAAMQSVGVLGRILPGADAQYVAPLIHIEDHLDAPIDPMPRLATLAPLEILGGLRFSKAQSRTLAILREGVESLTGAGELGYRHGAHIALQIIALRGALMSHMPGADAVAQIAKGASAQCPVTARDLMPAFKGAALGAELARIEARWIASDFTLTAQDLLK